MEYNNHVFLAACIMTIMGFVFHPYYFILALTLWVYLIANNEMNK